MISLRFDANLKWLFTEVPFEERFDAAAAAGFAGVEYSSPYAHATRDLRRRLADAGLQQVLINTPTALGSTPGAESIYRQGVLRAVDTALELECGLVHLMGGTVPPQVNIGVALDVFYSNVVWSAERAQGSPIRLVVEAQNQVDVPGMVFADQAAAYELVARVGSPCVGLLLDVYHVAMSGGEVVDVFKSLADEIFHVQIADAPGRHEPGTASIDWRRMLNTVRASGYAGWIGCEYRPLADTTRGLVWMKEYAQ